MDSPLRFAFAALAWGAVGTGCQGSSSSGADAATEGAFHIEMTPESVAIKPGESQLLAFRLANELGNGVPGRVIQLTIVDDPTTLDNEARGATLSFDRSVTNADGRVTVQVIAGLPTIFRVRASAMGAQDADVVVSVSTATHAAAQISPVPEVRDEALTTVRLFFYDDVSCLELEAMPKPDSIWPVRTLAIDASATYSSVSTAANHAVIAVGLTSKSALRQQGCVDVPGAALLPQAVVRIVLPMHVVPISTAGQYQVVSQFLFAQPLRAGAAMADAWKDLSRCPLDPASLWLDCTIDALVVSATDPLDCLPLDQGEGALGNKLMLRRGALPAGAGLGKCRGSADGGGLTSHDEMASQLFPVPRPARLAQLPDIGKEASQLLESIRLQSTITLAETPYRGELRAEHRLSIAQFQVGGVPVPVPLLPLGAPMLTARFVPVFYEQRQLRFATHGFTLRYGSAAHEAFARSSLTPRGLPVDSRSLLAAIFSLATFTDPQGATYAACAALDARLCADAGEPTGCLAAACADGLEALARRLDSGFVALDGEDLDFLVGGNVPIVDEDDNLTADGLGGDTPGLWSAELRARGGHEAISGNWTATRIMP